MSPSSFASARCFRPRTAFQSSAVYHRWRLQRSGTLQQKIVLVYFLSLAWAYTSISVIILSISVRNTSFWATISPSVDVIAKFIAVEHGSQHIVHKALAFQRVPQFVGNGSDGAVQFIPFISATVISSPSLAYHSRGVDSCHIPTSSFRISIIYHYIM